MPWMIRLTATKPDHLALKKCRASPSPRFPVDATLRPRQWPGALHLTFRGSTTCRSRALARRRHVHRLSQTTPFIACGGKRCEAPRRVHPMLADLLQARSHGHGRRLPAHTVTTWVTGSTWYIPATSALARDRTAARTSGDPVSTWRAHQRGARPCEPAPRDAPLSQRLRLAALQ